MFPRYLKRFWLIGLALALIVPLAACHGGMVPSSNGGDGESGDDGGDITTPPSVALSDPDANAKNGVIIEFSEPMDPDSVEENLAIFSGTIFSDQLNQALASLSKAVSPGVIRNRHLYWSDDFMRLWLVWPAPYSMEFTIVIGPNAESADGVPLGEPVSLTASTGTNPSNFDGDAADTSELYINPADTPSLFILPMSVMIEDFYITSGGINPGAFKEGVHWRYSWEKAYQLSQIADLGRISADSGTAVAARIEEEEYYIGIFLGYAPEDTSPVMKIGTDLLQLTYPASAGDMDGDGYNEIVFHGYPDSDTQSIYLVKGRGDFVEHHGHEPATDSLSVTGTVLPHRSKFCDALQPDADGLRMFPPQPFSSGDRDGDRLSDLAFCLTAGDKGEETDTVYIAWGATSLAGLNMLSGARIANDRTETGIRLGKVVSADLNGDRISDLVVLYTDSLDDAAGEAGALIFFGRDGVRSDMVITDYDVKIELGQALWAGVDALGDVNADGFHDIALWALNIDELGNPISIDTWLFLGRPQEEWTEVEPSFVWGYEVDEMGMPVTLPVMGLKAIGDLNNDGFDDVIMRSIIEFVMGGGADVGGDVAPVTIPMLRYSIHTAGFAPLNMILPAELGGR